MKRILTGVLLLVAASQTWAATTLNMKDADINTLISTVSEVTGKNFIVDDQVKGKVTVISSKPMSAAGVYETFLAVLAVKGFAVVPAGEAYKIVRAARGSATAPAGLTTTTSPTFTRSKTFQPRSSFRSCANWCRRAATWPPIRRPTC